MINIILEKEVYPELIQYNLTVSNILESIENMLINNGWNYIWDNDGQVPYLQNTSQTKIITIDDSVSVSIKSGYAISNNLGGLMIWALGYDYIGGIQKLIQTMKYNYLE